MFGSWLARPCARPSAAHRESAKDRQSQLTKPAGALGQLETVAIHLAGLQGTERPALDQVAALVFAADHGVTARGVSAYPGDVTVQMLHNFAGGGAAISVMARELGLDLHVRDVGSRATEHIPGVVTDKLRHGTVDFSADAAMEATALNHALNAGVRALDATANHTPPDMVIPGDMGIGNTTAASAVAASLSGLSPQLLTGAGTGVAGEQRAHKQTVIEQALDRHDTAIRQAALPGAEALRRVGGLEIAAMVGAMIGAAQRGIAVLVDGFIASSAALAAVNINPEVRAWLLFSHLSSEQGHRQLLDVLEARPLLALDMRLGEGSGAALSLPLLRHACALHNNMATFAEAEVANREGAP